MYKVKNVSSHFIHFPLSITIGLNTVNSLVSHLSRFLSVYFQTHNLEYCFYQNNIIKCITYTVVYNRYLYMPVYASLFYLVNALCFPIDGNFTLSPVFLTLWILMHGTPLYIYPVHLR